MCFIVFVLMAGEGALFVLRYPLLLKFLLGKSPMLICYLSCSGFSFQNSQLYQFCGFESAFGGFVGGLTLGRDFMEQSF